MPSEQQQIAEARPNTTIERMWGHIQIGNSPAGCWEWVGGKRRDGYGIFSANGVPHTRAHRFAYELVYGPIPEGLVIDHLCRNPGCVNPLHLEAVTIGENLRRGIRLQPNRRRPTHCRRGHDLAVVDVRVYGRYRKCVACERICRAQRRAALEGEHV